jgi:hypothetical protein
VIHGITKYPMSFRRDKPKAETGIWEELARRQTSRTMSRRPRIQSG